MMLVEWQGKFPTCFEPYVSIFSKPKATQERIASLLEVLEARGLLSEEIVGPLLDRSFDYLDELVFLIQQLDVVYALNPLTTRAILALENTPSDLVSCVPDICAMGLPSPQVFTVILTSKDPLNGVAFMKRAVTGGADVESILHCLSTQVAMDGLRDALTLFDLSGMAYSKAHFELFCVLTSVLANPLCRTIFNARLRCFSDYQVEVVEPVTPPMACEIIHRLYALPDMEHKFHAFFNCFAPLRVKPCSQRDVVEVDVGMCVHYALLSYFESKISAVSDLDAFLAVNEMIKRVQAGEGDRGVFDQIKFSVGNWIESEDFISSRFYEELMEEIWAAFHAPQMGLEPLIEQLVREKGYLQSTGEMVRRFGFLAIAPRLDIVGEGVDLEARADLSLTK